MATEILYQSIVSSMQEGVILQYTNGKIGICNASAKQILKLANKPCNFNQQKIICESGNLITKENLPIQISLHTGKPCFNKVLGIYIANNSLVWISVNTEPLFRDEKVYAVLITFTDITKRKQAEEILKDNEHRYKAIIQDQTELICRYLPDGLLSFVNNAYCRYFGKTEAELIGHHLTPFSFDDLQDILIQIMEELTQENPVTETENSTISPSGQERWQHWVVRAMFNDEGKLFEYQAVGRDITERRQTEKELLRAKEDAEAATKAKSEFLANMSHEIRTPMNGVVGMAELLLNTELSSKQYEYAQTILKSTDALQTLINDILDFSKIEAGKLSLESARFDLKTAISEVAHLLTMTAKSKGFEVIMRYAPNAPHFFIGDAGRIRQILTNLVGNAIKFTDIGYVLIRAECQRKTLDSAWMKIYIEDTGIGIPANKLNSIFHEFTQADTSTTRQFGGTGLGLAISKQLVNMMGGKISVKSKLNKGSTFAFTIELPLAKTQTEKISKSEFTTQINKFNHKIGSNISALLVEDNDVNRLVAKYMLEQIGCKVTQAIDGIQALDALNQQNFDIIFMDINMPGMDGFETTKKIRELYNNNIIVAMTANAMQGDAEKCLANGMDNYISKPVNLERIFNVIKQYYPDSKISKQTADSPKLQSQKILLVEDNPINQFVTVNILEKIGCDVEIAENGEQAVQICKTKKYDLILMDISMPIMDGIEATNFIRQQDKTTPIIAITTSCQPDDIKRYLAVGMNICLPKPVNIENLTTIVKKYTVKDIQPYEIKNYLITNKLNDITEVHKLPIFDPVQAKRIAIGNIKILSKIIDRFTLDTPIQLQKLQTALQSDNQIDVERLAHSLKGSARSIGAARLGNLAFNAEICAKKNDLEYINQQLFSDLKDGFEQLKQVWEQTDWDNLL